MVGDGGGEPVNTSGAVHLNRGCVWPSCQMFLLQQVPPGARCPGYVPRACPLKCCAWLVVVQASLELHLHAGGRLRFWDEAYPGDKKSSRFQQDTVANT